jgi:hypothetical protein
MVTICNFILPTLISFLFFAEASSHPKPSSTVPFERDEVFVGREDTIMSINKAVEERIGRTSRRAALVGLGGVG